MQPPLPSFPLTQPLALIKHLAQKLGCFPKAADCNPMRWFAKLDAWHQAWQTAGEDFRIVFDRDPAAHHWLEVLFCYPGFHAIVLYRFAHWLHCYGIIFIPRLISHLTRFLTGIEIHPGAVIGKGVFIDHGMGVVIGETAIVGDYCLIYQGVTLGGTGKETGKRHPTLGQHVVVGAGAKILGNIAIGDYARIGAGSIVLRAVPSHCTAVGVPGRNICRTNTKTCPLEHGQVPDVEAVAIKALLDRIEHLEAFIEAHIQEAHIQEAQMQPLNQ